MSGVAKIFCGVMHGLIEISADCAACWLLSSSDLHLWEKDQRGWQVRATAVVYQHHTFSESDKLTKKPTL